jgi:protein involved in temperature-dependent protein secretion
MSPEAWGFASAIAASTIPSIAAAWFAFAAQRSASASKHTAGQARDSAKEAAVNSAPVSNGWTGSVTDRLAGIDGRLEVLGHLVQSLVNAQVKQSGLLGKHLEAHAEHDLNGKDKE